MEDGVSGGEWGGADVGEVVRCGGVVRWKGEKVGDRGWVSIIVPTHEGRSRVT